MASLLRKTGIVCRKCSLLNNQLDNIYNSSRMNSNRTSIGRVKRGLFRRLYPTSIVLPDGSTYTIRYPDPRRIIKMPLDINTLSEEERKIRLQKRRPVKKIEVSDEEEDNISMNKYQYLWKKKK